MKRELQQYAPELWHHWPVLTGYGKPVLDCHGVFLGHAFAIETKAPGKHPTPRQKETIADLRDAGCTVFVIGERVCADGMYSGLADLMMWLEDISARGG